MAGIYIHIPFCRQACHYCDFHFSTNLNPIEDMVKAIGTEIIDRCDYISDAIHTIYFGGGTPSLLLPDQVEYLLNIIRETFQVDPKAEITLEANPEDLTLSKALALYDLGINRLSVGIQTFDESKLKWMNRAHGLSDSMEAFRNAREAGFNNISLDLIYAIPDHSSEKWKADLQEITDLGPEHISLYGLTIEDKTVFGKWEQQNRLVQIPEDEAAHQYLFAVDYLRNKEYLQYEVSNFGKSEFHSRHNNAYWAGTPYLGVGPGAHSFDGKSRRFNIRNNNKYLKEISTDGAYYETEVLSKTQRINEQILTQLRTAKGLNLDVLRSWKDIDLTSIHADFIEDLKAQRLIEIKDGFLRLKPKGYLVADSIALKFFLPE